MTQFSCRRSTWFRAQEGAAGAPEDPVGFSLDPLGSDVERLLCAIAVVLLRGAAGPALINATGSVVGPGPVLEQPPGPRARVDPT